MFDFGTMFPYSDFHKLNLDWILYTIKKFGKRLDVIEKKINSLVPGTFPVSDGSDLCDEVYMSNYARTVYKNYGAQGMCIMFVNGSECVVQCMIQDNSHQYICIRNVETGDYIAQQIFSELGHANSCCTDGKYIYVATSGGDAEVYNIVKLNTALDVVETFSLGENIAPYGIGYNKGIFYVLGANNTIWLTRNFISWIDSINITSRNGAIGQGLYVDNQYIYVPRGNWYTNWGSAGNCVNVLDVYDKTGTYVKCVYLIAYTEIEECDILSDGTFIFSSNTNSSAVYLRGAVKPVPFTANGDNNRYPVSLTANNFYSTIYVNEDYDGFLQDGSEERPFSTVYMYLNSAPAYTANIRLSLLSDVHATTAFSGSAFSALDIDGNNHTWHGYVYSRNMKRVTITNLSFLSDVEEEYALDIYWGVALYLKNVTIDMTNYSACGIRAQGTILTLDACTFKNCASSKINLYSVEGNSRIINTLIDDGGYYALFSPLYGTYTDFGSENSLIFTAPQYSRPVFMVPLALSGTTFDMNNLLAPGDYLCNASSVTNLPEELAGGGGVYVTVRQFPNGSCVQTVRKYGGGTGYTRMLSATAGSKTSTAQSSWS